MLPYCSPKSQNTLQPTCFRLLLTSAGVCSTRSQKACTLLDGYKERILLFGIIPLHTVFWFLKQTLLSCVCATSSGSAGWLRKGTVFIFFRGTSACGVFVLSTASALQIYLPRVETSYCRILARLCVSVSAGRKHPSFRLVLSQHIKRHVRKKTRYFKRMSSCVLEVSKPAFC